MNSDIAALDLELAALMKEYGANEPTALPDAPQDTRTKAPQGKGFVPEAPQGEIINQLADDQKPQRTERERQLDAALKEERAKRKQQERERRALEERDRQRQANFETLLARVAAQGQAPSSSPPAQPKANDASIEGLDYMTEDLIRTDPFGALTKIADGYNRLIYERRSIAELQQRKAAEASQQQQQQQARAQAIGAFMQELDDIEKDFAEDVPDYNLACQFAVEVRRRQLATQFPAATKEQIAEHLQREMLGAAWEARAQGMNPAEATYRVAISLGYSPEQGRALLERQARGEAEPEPAPQPAPAPQQRKPAANPADPDPLKHIREGQKAAKSAGAGGGQAPPADTDLDALLDLDGETFLKSVDSFVSKQKRAR